MAEMAGMAGYSGGLRALADDVDGAASGSGCGTATGRGPARRAGPW